MENNDKFSKDKKPLNNKSRPSKDKSARYKSKSTHKDKENYTKKKSLDKKPKSYQGKPRRYRSDEDKDRKTYTKKYSTDKKSSSYQGKPRRYRSDDGENRKPYAKKYSDDKKPRTYQGKPRRYRSDEDKDRKTYTKKYSDDKKPRTYQDKPRRYRSDDGEKSKPYAKRYSDDGKSRSYQDKPRRYRRDEDDKPRSYDKRRNYKSKYKDDYKSSNNGKSYRKNDNHKFSRNKSPKDDKPSGRKKIDTTFKVQKIIANSGFTSRRTAEELILSGKVSTKQGKVALGDRLSLDEKLFVDGKVINHFQTETSQLLMYNKPVGEIVSNVGADTVFDNLPKIAVGKWINVGRLDVESEGLILFTNNGDLANKFAHPSFGVEREYLVKSRESISEEIMEDAIANGIDIIGEVIKPIHFSKRASKSGKYFWYEITLSQGRNRVIRKLFKVLDADVTRLIRIRFGDIILPKELKTGEWIYLKTPDNL